MQAKIGEMIIVTGTATKDAEFQLTKEKHTPLCKFGLAVGKNKDTTTIFANVVAWRAVAENAADVCKGDSVFVVGKLDTREYNGKTYTDLIAEIVLINSKITNPTTQNTDTAQISQSQARFEDLSDDDVVLPF